jgi:hypothetical protein
LPAAKLSFAGPAAATAPAPPSATSRPLTGTYHSVKFAKYGYRYLAEVQFRFNRRYDMRAMLGSLLRALAATPKQPERGIRVAEVHR